MNEALMEKNFHIDNFNDNLGPNLRGYCKLHLEAVCRSTTHFFKMKPESEKKKPIPIKMNDNSWKVTFPECLYKFLVEHFFDVTDSLGIELGCLLYSRTAPGPSTKEFTVDGAIFFPQIVATSSIVTDNVGSFEGIGDQEALFKHLGWHRIGWMHSHNKHPIEPTLSLDVPRTYEMMFESDCTFRPLMIITNNATTRYILP